MCPVNSRVQQLNKHNNSIIIVRLNMENLQCKLDFCSGCVVVKEHVLKEHVVKEHGVLWCVEFV